MSRDRSKRETFRRPRSPRHKTHRQKIQQDQTLDAGVRRVADLRMAGTSWTRVKGTLLEEGHGEESAQQAIADYSAEAEAYQRRAHARQRLRNRFISAGMAALGVALTLLLLFGEEGVMMAWAPSILLVGAGIAVVIEPDLLDEIGGLFR